MKKLQAPNNPPKFRMTQARLMALLFCVGMALNLSLPDARAAGTPNPWTGAAGDLLWSSAMNWASNYPAGSSDSAQFDAVSGTTNTPGVVNNIVDLDTTVQQLWYSPVAPAYHTTLINPGTTLSVLDPSLSNGDLLAVRLNVVPETTISHVAIRGGRLVVGDLAATPPTAGGTTLMRVHAPSLIPGPFWATLDMSELDYFGCATAEIRVGANGSGAGTQGTLILARTNLLIVGSTSAAGTYVGFTIGHTSASGAGDYPSAGDVQLGQENVLQAYSLRVGALRATNVSLGGPGGGVGNASKSGAGGTMEFRSGLINPTLRIRGVDGIVGLQNLMIGDNTGLSTLGSSTNMSTGVMDLTGGKVDILAANLQLGRNSASATASRTGDGSGTFTVTDGIVEITNLVRIGTQAGNNSGSAYGVLNVRGTALLRSLGGTFNIGGDTGSAAGSGNGTLNIEDDAVVEVASDVAETSGSGGNGNSTIQVHGGYLSAGAAITVDNVSVASGVISNAGPMTVATLKGNGVISGPVTVSGSLEPGQTIGALEIFNDLAIGPDSTNLFEVDLGTLACDQVKGLGTVNFSGTLVVRNTGGTGAITNGATLRLFTAANYQGAFTSTDLPVLSGGFAWDTSELATGILRIVSSVQEPTTITMQTTADSLGLAWPESYLGWYVQSNSVGLGSVDSWYDVPGSELGTNLLIKIDSTKPNVFFRLRK